jgi:DNA polymerase-1
MPLVNADVSGLEVVVAGELSQDRVLCSEIRTNTKLIHTDNQIRFGLPDRRDAKIFMFRLLYGGSAFSYANDPYFMEVSSSVTFWQGVIDEFYTKYTGIKKWHDSLIRQFWETRRLEIPSGRFFQFELNQWGKPPETILKNYPVQGFGADLVKLARLEYMKQLRASGLKAKFICTIHDSLVVDCPAEEVMQVAVMLKNAIEKVPLLCKQVWDYEFSLPLSCEVQVGSNKKDMEDIVFS